MEHLVLRCLISRLMMKIKLFKKVLCIVRKKMYSNHRQSGRSRVNKVREGIKNRKTHVQQKRKTITAMDKLFLLQDELFRDGLNLGEYTKYIQEKINEEKYYYKALSEENVMQLKDRYLRLIQIENNRYNERGDEQQKKRKQRKIFREKKRRVIHEKKRELIHELLREIDKANSIGITHRAQLLSDDPDKWYHTKLLLFTGGRYIESHDKDWTKIYKKIVSPTVSSLFNLSNHQDLNQYVFQNHTS